eukprot:9277614-Alexandrium_andersonii.AAC.1
MSLKPVVCQKIRPADPGGHCSNAVSSACGPCVRKREGEAGRGLRPHSGAVCTGAGPCAPLRARKARLPRGLPRRPGRLAVVHSSGCGTHSPSRPAVDCLVPVMGLVVCTRTVSSSRGGMK